MDGAVVLDIDRTTSRFDNTADILAASTDNGTNLVGFDADAGNTWRVLGEIVARSVDRFKIGRASCRERVLPPV